MPCEICGKGRYPRPHAACKRRIRVAIVHSSQTSAAAARERAWKLVGDYLCRTVAGTQGWTATDEADFDAWMGMGAEKDPD